MEKKNISHCLDVFGSRRVLGKGTDISLGAGLLGGSYAFTLSSRILFITASDVDDPIQNGYFSTHNT